nr:cytosolic sulfotransferase 5-like [Tanacetum cinerariifolium]
MTKFDHLPKPRLFAKHHPHELLPTSMTSPTSLCKFVYVCRDPKDVLISKWDFMNKLRSKDLVPISFNEAYESFCNGVSEYSPFWDHVLGYWKASNESPNKILFLKFEDMKKEPMVEVRKLAEFMGMPFTPHEEEKGVVRQRFTAKETIENKNFFRKGVVGDWENYLTEEMKNRIDSITSDKLKGSGLTLGLTK